MTPKETPVTDTTDTTDLAYTPALEQAAMIRRGELSPVELVEAYLTRIERLDPSIGAYITVAADSALADAKAKEAAVREGDLPPFHGVPLALKDMVDTAGIRTTYGSGGWRSRVPDRDHAVVAKLRQAGFILLGKAKMPEFSGGVITEPEAYGPARNPWDPDRSPGGSSGGSAAAVAAGLAPIAHGSDDGGSIRIPSGWCGVFGIKPSRGRISCAPDPQAMEFTNGPIARTVADAAAMLDAMAGYVTGDAFWAPPPERPLLAEAGTDPGRLKVAFTTSAAEGVEVHDDAAGATRRAAALLETLGHEVEEVDDWPGRGRFPDERALPLHLVYGAKFDALIGIGLMPPLDQLEATGQLLVQASATARAADLMLANHYAAETSRELVAFFEHHDVLLTPVMACRPPEVGRFVGHPEEAIGLLQAVQWTAQFSVSGQPAVAVPMGLDSGGTPVGVQLAGRPADEATLIRLAAQIEQANPWIDRRPPLAS
jgi:amidase